MYYILTKVPVDIYILIKMHFYSTIIQNIFKINRPLTNFNIGDRVYFKKNIKIYGTITNIKNKYSEILLLPRLIPFWKRCNANFWINNKYFLENNFNTDFPYYSPKIKIKNDKIIKLCNWNEIKLDGSKRIHNEFKNLNIKKSNLFNYYY